MCVCVCVCVFVCVCVCVCVFICATSPPQTVCGSRPSLKRSTVCLKSLFSFSYIGCCNKAREPTIIYYLSVANERIDGLIHFPSELA